MVEFLARYGIPVDMTIANEFLNRIMGGEKQEPQMAQMG
jgi:hypothetical protein